MQVNAIKEIFHQVLGNPLRMYNLQETFVDDSDPWVGILVAELFYV